VHIAELDDLRRDLVLDARVMPVEAFVEKHAQRLSDHQTKVLAGEGDATANPPREPLLSKALVNLATIDFVGLTERLSDTAACVAWGAGLFNSMNSRIQTALAELNSCDAALYAEGELQFLRMLHRWKRAVLQKQSTPPAAPLAVGQRVVLSMDDPLIGDGWHEREGPPVTSCRWGGPERLSSLFFNFAAQGTLEVTITIVSTICPEVFEGFQLVIHGRPAPHTVTSSGQRLVARARASCDGSAESEPLHLEFRFPSSRSAFDVAGVDDHRKKTIAVEAVELHRVG
jgi:hypothetical protein